MHAARGAISHDCPPRQRGFMFQHKSVSTSSPEHAGDYLQRDFFTRCGVSTPVVMDGMRHRFETPTFETELAPLVEGGELERSSYVCEHVMNHMAIIEIGPLMLIVHECIAFCCRNKR